MRDDFAVFILTHGRADNVKTVKALEKAGYTGKTYLICDNEDKQLNKYVYNFGKENIIVFDKINIAKKVDTFDNLHNQRNSIVFARNVCHEIAKFLNLTYFLELEDDYELFRSRIWDGKKLSTVYCKNLDKVIDCVIEFLDCADILTVAFAQTGDFIGGVGSGIYKQKLSRKAMNSFFCKVNRPFKFFGRMNDDVNAYTLLGSQGKLFFTIADFCLDQPQTQSNLGGNTDMYKQYGTYFKSFQSVMCMPSCIKIFEIGTSHKRIHHLIDWEHCVPKIVSSKFKL